MNTPATHRDRRAQNRNKFAFATGFVALPAWLLHRMRGVEYHGACAVRLRLAGRAYRRRRVVTERNAALVTSTYDSAPVIFSRRLHVTGKKRPFFTLMALPVLAAAIRRSVWRQRNAGICRTSTATADARIVSFVNVGEHWHLQFIADFGEYRQRLFETKAAHRSRRGAVSFVE